MPLEIIRNDITKLKVDAIVNASNTKLKKGGGVSGAIFAAAGEEALQKACDAIGHCGIGEAVITGAFGLSAKYIIHTVGPIWEGGEKNEEALLHHCYENSLKLASSHKCNSVAFPLISSGTYGFPKDKAFNTAVSAISSFLMDHDMKVYLVVYDKKAVAISEKLFANIQQYIDDHYEEEHSFVRTSCEYYDHEIQYNLFVGKAVSLKKKRKLEDLIVNLDETFSQMLLRLIDEKGFADVETYKKANIDRKLFSKIKSNKDYNPKKSTALAFAIALELNLDETLDLLGKAGYTLSNSSKFDTIIRFFIDSEVYDIYTINQALFYYDQLLLGE